MIKKISLVFMVFGSLLLSGCGEEQFQDLTVDDGSELIVTNQSVIDKRVEDRSNFNFVVGSLPELNQEAVLGEPLLLGMPITNRDGNYQTVVTKYKMVAGFDTHILFDPTSDVIWPGGLIDGNSIKVGSYVPIVSKNRPVTISISLENIWGKKSRCVQDAKLSTIRDAVGEILAQNINGATPAKVSFTITEVHSEDQLKIALGANYNCNNNTIKSQFDFNNSSIKSRVIVQFIQVYYTIDIDTPETPASFFAEETDWSLLQNKMSGTSPMYVSTMKYGRLALFSFESTASIIALKAAINYSFNAVVNGGGEISVVNETILNATTIKATILGGDGVAAAGAVNGFNGLKSYLIAGGNYSWNSPGAPIAYKLRYLANNAIAEIVLTGEYSVVKTQRVSSRFRVENIDLICLSEDDFGNTEELYGYIDLKAYVGDVEVDSVDDKSPLLWVRPSSNTVDLAKGESFRIGESREFIFIEIDLPVARIVMRADLKENDTFGDDSLGYHSLTIYLDNCEEKRYYLDGFAHDGTRVRIGFDLVLVQ